MSRPFAERIAAAPISWGVCEVPGWGWQYDVATVLGQMRELGLAATEFGPEGFLPRPGGRQGEGAGRARAARRGRVRPGGPARAGARPRARRPRRPRGLRRGGCADAGARRRDRARRLRRAARCWTRTAGPTLLANLDRLARAATEVGVTATLHPHVGTMVENAAEVRRVLDDSGIGLCLDTGHLLIGGADPVALARDHADRVAARPPQGRRRRAGRPRVRAGRDRLHRRRPARACTGRSARATSTSPRSSPARGGRVRRLVRARAGHHPQPGRPPASPASRGPTSGPAWRTCGPWPGCPECAAVPGSAWRPAVRMSEQSVDAPEGTCFDIACEPRHTGGSPAAGARRTAIRR